MKKNLYLILVLSSSIGITGCSNNKATLLTASSEIVSYQYDPILHSNAEDAGSKANIHCATYGKRAELKNMFGSTFGFTTAIFNCVK